MGRSYNSEGEETSDVETVVDIVENEDVGMVKSGVEKLLNLVVDFEEGVLSRDGVAADSVDTAFAVVGGAGPASATASRSCRQTRPPNRLSVETAHTRLT